MWDSLGPQLLEVLEQLHSPSAHFELVPHRLPAGNYEHRFENTDPDCPTCALIALAHAKVTDGMSIVN